MPTPEKPFLRYYGRMLSCRRQRGWGPLRANVFCGAFACRLARKWPPEMICVLRPWLRGLYFYISRMGCASAKPN